MRKLNLVEVKFRSFYMNEVEILFIGLRNDNRSNDIHLGNNIFQTKNPEELKRYFHVYDVRNKKHVEEIFKFFQNNLYLYLSIQKYSELTVKIFATVLPNKDSVEEYCGYKISKNGKSFRGENNGRRLLNRPYRDHDDRYCMHGLYELNRENIQQILNHNLWLEKFGML